MGWAVEDRARRGLPTASGRRCDDARPVAL